MWVNTYTGGPVKVVGLTKPLVQCEDQKLEFKSSKVTDKVYLGEIGFKNKIKLERVTPAGRKEFKYS